MSYKYFQLSVMGIIFCTTIGTAFASSPTDTTSWLELIEKNQLIQYDTGYLVEQGQPIIIKGVIISEDPAPYHYNLELCSTSTNFCKYATWVETDATGNYFYKFWTTNDYPIGLYKIEIEVFTHPLLIMYGETEFTLIGENKAKPFLNFLWIIIMLAITGTAIIFTFYNRIYPQQIRSTNVV